MKPKLTQKRLQGLWILMRAYQEECVGSCDYASNEGDAGVRWVTEMRDWWEAENGRDLFDNESKRQRKIAKRADRNEG